MLGFACGVLVRCCFVSVALPVHSNIISVHGARQSLHEEMTAKSTRTSMPSPCQAHFPGVDLARMHTTHATHATHARIPHISIEAERLSAGGGAFENVA
jgi:hypothetical protein